MPSETYLPAHDLSDEQIADDSPGDPLLPLQFCQQQDDNCTHMQQLQEENRKLRRICAALIERVEANSPDRPDPYAAFQHSITLAEQVRERTDALNQAMAELKASNFLLREAREKTETANQRLVDAIESISDAFVLFDQQQRIVQFNSHFTDFCTEAGISVGLGTTLQQFRQKASRSGMVMEERSGQGAGTTLYRLRSGQWVQASERPTREGGQVMLYTDITELKASEQALREQALAQKTRLLQNTVNSLSQGVAVVNADGFLELWNGRFLALTGVSQAQPHMRLAEVLAATELGQGSDSKDRKLLGGSAYEQRLLNGKVLEVRSHAMPSGGVVNTFTDITERYHYAETLKESERWVRQITDQIPALIAYVGDDLRYTFTNRGYDDWYGWQRGSAIGNTLVKMHRRQQYSRLQPYIEQAFAGRTVTFEFPETNASGQERYLLRTYVPNFASQPGADAVAGSSGQKAKVMGIFVLIRDITERRKHAEALQLAYQSLEARVEERTQELSTLNAQLRDEVTERQRSQQRMLEAKQEAERANLSKTKFLAAVSHDLLQPLNAARLFTGALLEAQVSEQQGNLAKSINHALEDVEALLGTLVDISKLDAGVMHAEIVSFDLRDLLTVLATEFRQVAGAEGLDFRCHPLAVQVSSDPQLLSRILRNLLSNAVRYTPHGGILLGCRMRRGKVCIEVWDTGMGIPADKQEEIFQEFRRVNPPAHRQDRGLGLGLAIVDKIARMLGYEVKVTSRPGRGSTFSVSIPLAPDQVPVGASTRDSLPQPGNIDLGWAPIWLVDNDHAICEAMTTLLEKWGCQVISATSLADLNRQVDIAEDQAALLIADYHLDNETATGLDVVEHINAARTSALPVLMITANYSLELKQQIKQQGYLLMHKPVKPLKLKMALLQLFGSQVASQ